MESKTKDIEMWKTVKSLILSGAKLSDIVEGLSKISDKDRIQCMRQESPDEYYKWDLLHFAIYAKRRDVVEYLFKEDLFLPSSKAGTTMLPYSHMACVCCDIDIVDLTMHHRPQEKDLIIHTQALDWDCFLEVFKKGKKYYALT